MKQKPNPQFVAEFKQAIEDYQWDNPDELEMMEMFAKDRHDFETVLSLYQSGDFAAAATKARRIDTAARDYIPEGLWNELSVYM